MKKYILVLPLLLFFAIAYAQERTNVDYYNDGMKYAQRGNYKEAIGYFDMAIKLKPDDYFSMHNRGIAKSLMKDYNAAIADFLKVLNYKHDYIDSYIAIGNCYKNLTHYDSAASYYSSALQIDPANVKAFYFRAYIYETMLMIDSAVADFTKAFDLGAEQVDDKLEYYEDTSKYPKKHSVTPIRDISTDATYGFTQKNPVKVGVAKTGGGFANVRAYLNQLKDERGKPIQYQRIKACCPYKPQGYTGNVFLEEYKITYNSLSEGEKTATIYLTFYEYAAPKVLLGFKPTAK